MTPPPLSSQAEGSGEFRATRKTGRITLRSVEGIWPMVQKFVVDHPDDAALVIDGFKPADIARLYARMTAVDAAALAVRLNADLSSRGIAMMENPAAATLLAAMDPAEAARLVGRLPADDRERLIANVAEKLRADLQEILSYPPASAGSVMEANVAQFKIQTPVEQALAWLRETRSQRVTDLVITDETGRFEGVVHIQDLVGADPTTPVGALMDAGAVSIHPMAPREEVVDLINSRRLMSVPVVDSARRVVGVIRYGALLEAAQETAATDVQQMFGASKEEGALSSPWLGIRSRLPWLYLNLVTAFLAAFVVGLFESTLAKFTALAVLLPVVAGQSGNTGAQALAVAIRGLALREIRPAHALRVIRKEVVVGLVNGLSIAVVTALGAYLWSGSRGLALVMFLAMSGSMLIASCAGAAVPMVLKRLGRDPAVASSIFLTTITDVVGFMSFLGLATLLSGMLTGL
jgi:magnesium transporter